MINSKLFLKELIRYSFEIEELASIWNDRRLKIKNEDLFIDKRWLVGWVCFIAYQPL